MVTKSKNDEETKPLKVKENDNLNKTRKSQGDDDIKLFSMTNNEDSK